MWLVVKLEPGVDILCRDSGSDSHTVRPPFSFHCLPLKPSVVLRADQAFVSPASPFFSTAVFLLYLESWTMRSRICFVLWITVCYQERGKGKKNGEWVGHIPAFCASSEYPREHPFLPLLDMGSSSALVVGCGVRVPPCRCSCDYTLNKKVLNKNMRISLQIPVLSVPLILVIFVPVNLQSVLELLREI